MYLIVNCITKIKNLHKTSNDRDHISQIYFMTLFYFHTICDSGVRNLFRGV